MHILVLNAGSSSIKYRVIEPHSKRSLLEGKVERLGQGKSHAQGFEEVMAQVREAGLAIDAVGHRVVHGGATYSDAVLITADVEAVIEKASELAPIHNPHNLAGIRAARSLLPEVAHVAVFDTAFHATLPRRASTYAIDQTVAETHQMRRFGFHGTSHRYVAELAAASLGRPLQELRLVSLHLGNGASACAIEFGHSTETSMGMTPLDGLVMGTRPGDLDPGIVLKLVREGYSADEVETFLNETCGLAGLTGGSNDMRDIEARAAAGDDKARLAISVFAHRVRKYIGAYAATMGGLDGVILTGGIGENSIAMRRRILQRFDFLGLVLDEERNETAQLSHERPVAEISTANSRVKVLAVKTDEELAIALATSAIVRGKAELADVRPIPIAVSARHLHLDRATTDALFGPGYELKKLRDISQPGQFACEELVNLVGPRGRIERVRVLGPLRKQTQVEVSRTDEFKLGVDAPIRDSGQLENSAPITLEGPYGTVHLKEGLICAKRHIHMTPEDAAHFGVADGDEVEVAVTGGPRSLIFGDVLIRVSPKYRLEMHIDTDEANAAEIDNGAVGDLVYTETMAQGLVRRRRLRSGD